LGAAAILKQFSPFILFQSSRKCAWPKEISDANIRVPPPGYAEHRATLAYLEFDQSKSSLTCVSELKVVGQNAEFHALDYNQQHPACHPGNSRSSRPARLLPGVFKLSCSREG
jgi:hypothetical protein